METRGMSPGSACVITGNPIVNEHPCSCMRCEGRGPCIDWRSCFAVKAMHRATNEYFEKQLRNYANTPVRKTKNKFPDMVKAIGEGSWFFVRLGITADNAKDKLGQHFRDVSRGRKHTRAGERLFNGLDVELARKVLCCPTKRSSKKRVENRKRSREEEYRKELELSSLHPHLSHAAQDMKRAKSTSPGVSLPPSMMNNPTPIKNETNTIPMTTRIPVVPTLETDFQQHCGISPAWSQHQLWEQQRRYNGKLFSFPYHIPLPSSSSLLESKSSNQRDIDDAAAALCTLHDSLQPLRT